MSDDTQTISSIAKKTEQEIIGILDEICRKGIVELTEPDIAFLKARQSYLTDRQFDKFKSILKPEPKVTPKEPEPISDAAEENLPVPEPNEEPEQTEAEKPKKGKGKK